MFIEADIEVVLAKLANLKENAVPLWGGMKAQRMVEHLADIVRISNGKVKMDLLVPQEKVERMQQFLDSDKPMAKNVEVPFAEKDVALRHSEMELAIDELVEEWVDFQECFEGDLEKKITHPYYGNLNFDQWKRVHSKHISHHFQQFEIA
jgi:hypothetical protein